MRTANQLVIIFLCVELLSGCVKEPVFAPDPYEPQIPEYYSLFNNTNGWIGSDAAYSVPLSSQKTLWLFGDTWQGTITDNRRVNASITANNTIAIQDGTDPATASLNYYFGSVQPSFFTPDDNRGFLWPLHGTMIGSELYLFFVQVETTGSDLFAFDFIGSKMIRITNPLESPSQWQMTQYDIPHVYLSHSRQVVYGTSVLQKDGYIYIYGTETNDNNSRYLQLSRVAANSITDFSAWRFYGQGQWQSNYQFADHLTDRVGFELSVSYQPSLNKYVLITTENGLSPHITIQYADLPWASWTGPTVIYQCPEAGWGSNILNYAAKGHPELSAGNELLITYVANSRDINNVIDNAELYWPRFIRINF